MITLPKKASLPAVLEIPIRVLAFVRKELFGVLRQPRLIIGLVLGPFIIMALFGIGYQASFHYNTILVVPNRPEISTNPQDYKEFSKQTFKLNTISKNEQASLAALNRGEADAVIVVPADSLDQIYSGHSAKFPTYYRNFNPIEANLIEYSSYVYISELDKVVLREALAASKPPAEQLQALTNQLNTTTTLLDQAMQQGNLAQAKLQLQLLKALNETMRRSLDSLILPGSGANQNASTSQKLLSSQLSEVALKSGVGQIKPELDNNDKKLDSLEQGFNQGDINSPTQRANLDQIRQSTVTLGQKVTRLAAIPPAVMVEPVLSDAKNLVSTNVSYVNFYGPAVVILLLQHLAVILIALSNVRDRLMGTFEIYRAAPIGPSQILTGKFIGLAILLLALSALLIGLISLALGVPFVQFEQRWPLVLAILGVTIYASIGLGVLIAGISHTETQAVQWSMILLLASIFFSGFIVPLSQFSPYIQYLGYALPMTFGAAGLQRVMLDTLSLDLATILIPLGLGTVYMVIGYYLYRRQFNLG
jgi:ABC-2 type transport system permease protein